MKVYLCGPINGCTTDECRDWREQMKPLLANFSIDTIDPMRRDYRGAEHVRGGEIVDLDKRDIRESDTLLVRFVKPSVGTSMEIFYAHQNLGLPVCVWADEGLRLPPWLVQHSTRIVYTAEAAAITLREWTN